MRKLTQKEFDLKAAQILSAMRAEATPFLDSSEEDRKKRIARARVDRFFFFKTYLPHYFTMDFSEAHREWLALASIPNELVLVAAPREHAKSTFFSLGIPLHDILFELRHFIILISDTEDQATDMAAFIKLELEENQRIKQDFGNLRGRLYQWGDSDFVTKTGIRVKSRGRGQKIRGYRNRQHRPDRVVIDDLENDKTVRNPRMVKETIDWILTAVLGSLGDGFYFTMIGTILSKKSVLSQLMAMRDKKDRPRFLSKIYRAIDADGIPLWPARWPIERLEKRKEQMGSVRFNQEFQNDPKDEEGLFREEWVRYYHPDEIKGKELWTFTAADPSMSSGQSNDFKAIITISRDRDGIIYVRNAYIRHTTPDGMVRALYNRYEDFHPITMGCEENSIKEFLDTPFNVVASEKGYHLPLRKIQNNIAKEARIARLSPLIEHGKIRFLKGDSDQDKLVEQLIFFGQSGVHDDGPDALEMAVRLSQKVADLVVVI